MNAMERIANRMKELGLRAADVAAVCLAVLDAARLVAWLAGW